MKAATSAYKKLELLLVTYTNLENFMFRIILTVRKLNRSLCAAVKIFQHHYLL
jgi:hypothetical protein